MFYSPLTEEQRTNLLEEIGLSSIDQLFSDMSSIEKPSQFVESIPNLSELQMQKVASQLAKKNTGAGDLISFMGAGSYQHFIPSVVWHLAGRSEFYTAYTPYQPEMSQGTLRIIFEFQTMISELFGLPISNASLYDGATALAEACVMALNKSKRKKILVPHTISWRLIEVLKTYLEPKNIDVDVVESSVFYHLNLTRVSPKLSEELGALILPYPDFFGNVLNYESLIEKAKSLEIPVIFYVDPIAMSLFKSPGELGADIVVAEGQALGIPMSYGGPYLGLIAAKEDYIRLMPGRIVGETVDSQGKPGYVLTFQAREQHIRREKSLSNICSNQGLLAIAATIYLSYMGPKGLRKVAELCYKKTEYLKKEISEIPGFSVLNQGLTFKEILVSCPILASDLIKLCKKKNILPGVDMKTYTKASNVILIAVTEVRSQSEIDYFIETLKGIRA